MYADEESESEVTYDEVDELRKMLEGARIVRVHSNLSIDFEQDGEIRRLSLRCDEASVSTLSLLERVDEFRARLARENLSISNLKLEEKPSMLQFRFIRETQCYFILTPRDLKLMPPRVLEAFQNSSEDRATRILRVLELELMS